jgi:hypothetical protein
VDIQVLIEQISNFIKRLNDEIPNDGIPSQSALIAFFILAASNMGQDSEYRKNAYYKTNQE